MTRAAVVCALAGISAGVLTAVSIGFASSDDSTSTTDGTRPRGSLVAEDMPPSTRELGAPGLSHRAVQMLDLDPATIEPVGSFSPTTGGTHEVYLARKQSGETCLVEERVFGVPGRAHGGYGGGCNPGPLGARDLMISRSAQGDAEAAGTRGISIVGVAGSEIRRLTVTLDDGRELAVELNDTNGFQYSVAASKAGGAAAPRLFEGFDAAGRVAHRTPIR